MIKLYADYHTHTVYSHGKGTILDNVVEARKKGLKEVAIADHGPGHFSFGMEKHDLRKMREEIDRINEGSHGIKVLLGVEANLISMDGDIDVREEDMKYLDILLMGYHTAVFPKRYRDTKGLYIDNIGAKIFPGMYEKVKEQNTKALVLAIKRHHIDIITHPGLSIPIDTAELAREAAKTGTVLEINCSHGYLSVDYVKTAMKEGANFVINSDAHYPGAVGNFKYGIETAEAAGLPAARIINVEK